MSKVPEITKVENYLKGKYDIRYNEVSCEIEFRNLNTHDEFEILNENDFFIELLKNHYKISSARLNSLLSSNAIEKYNPFVEYFQALPKWDSMTSPDYIDKLTGYFKIKEISDSIDNTLRFKTQLKKMFVRSIACSLGIAVNKQAFILIHKKQNSGKSTFCRWLCPSKLDKYIAEDITVDKDGQIGLATNFIINLDELAAFSKVEINHFKSYLSKPKVKVRLPYGKKAVLLPRRCNFVGSTNQTDFLIDETGNVRYLNFELDQNIDFNYSKDILNDDVWSQAYSLLNSDFDYQLTVAELHENEMVNKLYMYASTESELIFKHFELAFKDTPGAKFATASDIMLRIQDQNPGVKLSSVKVGKALIAQGFVQEQKDKGKGYAERGYYIKEKRDSPLL